MAEFFCVPFHSVSESLSEIYLTEIIVSVIYMVKGISSLILAATNDWFNLLPRVRLTGSPNRA